MGTIFGGADRPGPRHFERGALVELADAYNGNILYEVVGYGWDSIRLRVVGINPTWGELPIAIGDLVEVYTGLVRKASPLKTLAFQAKVL